MSNSAQSVNQSDATAPATILMAFMAAMAAVVALSNYLVQYPVQARLAGIDLNEILTWGAFVYPVAFLVTDLANKKFGPDAARKVVAAGFVLAVIFSVWLATPRIAIASGSAFLVAQLLDVSIFDRLRRSSWWRAPLISSLLGSLIDTALFFGIAFAPAFAMLDFGGKDGSLGAGVPFFGIGPEFPLWISLAVGDLMIKVLVGFAMLLPYGLVARRQLALA